MMSNWLDHHIQAIKLVLARMRANLLSSFMICLVVSVAICLPGLFYLGVDSLNKLTNHMQDETEISLFLKLDADTGSIAKIDVQLAKNDAIKHYRLVKRDEAWRQLQAKSEGVAAGADNVLHQLEQNPLPDAFFIQAKSADPAALETLRSELQKLPDVEQALLNAEWAQRLSTLLSLGRKIIFFVAALLAVALLVTIGNTIRMQILTQKDEIEVSSLMGATSSFIRTPFLYAGMLYGLFGGLLAIVLIVTAVLVFNYSIAQVASLYHSDFSISILNADLFLTIIGVSVLIGWLGSFIAVTRSIAAFKIN